MEGCRGANYDNREGTVGLEERGGAIRMMGGLDLDMTVQIKRPSVRRWRWSRKWVSDT